MAGDQPRDTDADAGDGTGAGGPAAVPNEDAASCPGATVEAPDPTRDLPSPTVEVPDPSAPPAAETDAAEAADVPRDLRISFWYLVAIFDAALLAVGVGVLLMTLGDDPGLGGRLLFVGAVFGLYGYYRYRQHPYRTDADAETDATG